jgi:hypothetical protein
MKPQMNPARPSAGTKRNGPFGARVKHVGTMTYSTPAKSSGNDFQLVGVSNADERRGTQRKSSIVNRRIDPLAPAGNMG